MTSKFGSLMADVQRPYKVELIDPATDDVIRDKDGKAAYVAVWAADSERGRDFDKAKRKDLQLRIRQSRTGRIEQDDQLEVNMAKCAALTDSWYLVDRVSGDPIDVPCTPENAADLYSPAGMGWIFLQVWVGANDAANFMKRPSRNSSSTASTSSDSVKTQEPEEAKAST